MQAAIYRDGLIPVHRETLVETDDGRRLTIQAAESLTGSVARRVYFWQSGQPVRYFNQPQ